MDAGSVYVGIWQDHSRGWSDCWQLLLPDGWAKIVVAFVAVWLAVSAPYLGRLKCAFIIWCYVKWKGIDKVNAESRDSGGERKPLLRTKAPNYNAIQQTTVSDTSQDSTLQTQRDGDESSEQVIGSASTTDPPDNRMPGGSSTLAPVAREAKGKGRETSSDLVTTPAQIHNEPFGSLSGDNAEATSQQNNRAENDPQSQRDDEGGAESQDPSSSEKPKIDVVHILEESESNRQIIWQFMRIAYHDRFSFKSATVLSWIFFLMFGVFVALVVAGISSAKIATDRAALSSSSACGIWRFDYEKAGEEAAYRDDLHSYFQEARAGQYARSCYNTSISSSLSTSCDSFYQKEINYTKTTGRECPFKSTEMCVDNAFSAVEFGTGLRDASEIGINADITHKFRRSTIFSPLNTSEEYVKPIPSTGGNASSDVNGFEYHYGATEEAKYTFRSLGDSFDWQIPAYSVNTYFSSAYPDLDYWWPRPQLRPPKESTVTIIFVRSTHIYHTEPSFDKIFPAEQERCFDWDPNPFYYNSNPKAGVLACVDKTELCSPDGTVCWSMTAPEPQGIPVTPAYWMMKWALESSTISDSITYRLGSALVAQESISQSIASNHLDPHQWELEAELLFATSLARIQFDAMAIATGEGRGRPGYKEITPEEGCGQLCNLFKFKTIGHTNINFAALIGLCLILPLLFVLSLEARKICLISEDENISPKPLVISVLFPKLKNGTVKLYRYGKKILRKLVRSVHV